MTEQRYSRVAIFLHWAIAALILLNLSIGWFMEGLPEQNRTLVVRLHQSSGMTVLVLTGMRILWRAVHRPPPFDATLTRAERHAASIVHAVLYLAMVALPISGWALISANPPRYEAATGGTAAPSSPRRPKYIMLWGVVPLHPIAPIEAVSAQPGGIERQRALHQRLVKTHKVAGYGLLALLALHVLAALKHELLDDQRALARMGLNRRAKLRSDVPNEEET